MSYNKYFTSNSQNWVRDSDLADEIVARAGPGSVYYRPGYQSEVSNVTKYSTKVTHLPASVSTVHYQINDDPDPVRVVRPTEPVSLRQNVTVRYLDPPNPPTPAPIIIKERQLTPPPPAPPIHIRQYAPPPPTPPPLIIRERPPTPPRMPDPTIIEKIIPAPSPPPRQVIVERIPAPEKPRDVIYEKWLPYQPIPDRQVIVERGRIYEKQPAPRNVIIDYENPRVRIDRRVYDEGVIKINDPSSYVTSRPNGELRVVNRISDLPMPDLVSKSTVVYQPEWTYIRPKTPTPKYSSVEILRSRPKTSYVNSPIKGPYQFNGAWNTTYRSSYTGRGFNKL